jgi:uracil-DNA glycosylase
VAVVAAAADLSLVAYGDVVAGCERCVLAQTRTQVVFGSGSPHAELMFVGEAPGFHEDKQGVPFVGAAGKLLQKLLEGIGMTRDDVYIANVLKCRPPGNRDPLPEEIAACQPFLRRQLEVLDPALVVTLGRFSMAAFMPGARISEAHGTVRPADPATGAADASVYALYHPAAALRSTSVAQTSLADVAGVPAALERSRARRAARDASTAEPAVVPVAVGPTVEATADLPLTPPAPQAAPSQAAPSTEAAEAAEQAGLFGV